MFGDEHGLRSALSRRNRPTGGFLAKARVQAARRREQGKYLLPRVAFLLMYALSARRDNEGHGADSEGPGASSSPSPARTLSSTSIGANRGGGGGETNGEGNCMGTPRRAQKRNLDATDEENREPGPSTQRPRN